MKILKWTIYFLFVVILLSCFYFVFQQKNIFEPISIGEDTEFCSKTAQLSVENQTLNRSLDKLNATYDQYNTQLDQYKINNNNINSLKGDVIISTQKIADEYKLIVNTVQPIMFLRFDNAIINNSSNIDPYLSSILQTTEYNKIEVSPNIKINTFNGKSSLELLGDNRYVSFVVIPTLTQFSFSFSIYNDHNSTTDPIISIENEKDFFEAKINSGIQVYINKIGYNGVTVKYLNNNAIYTLSNALNSGWNQITFTTGKLNACIYVNGKNHNCTNYISAPIQPLPSSYETLYRLKTRFFIGGNKYKGHIYNVRYYAVEIPPKVVSDNYKFENM